MSNPKSGGKRAVEKNHAEREAERNREATGGDWRAEWIARVDKIGAAPKKAERGQSWLGKAALLIVEATMRDTSIPPEQMRRDAMRQIEQASKVLDPAKLSEELAELERALEELHARNVSTREDREAPAPASLS